jgi:hypothetical protein
MSRRQSVEAGFAFWREEVASLQCAKKWEADYIPVVALVGVYATLCANVDYLTSYHWRRAVLENVDARAGLRQSLSEVVRDELDKTSLMPVGDYTPHSGASVQHHFVHHAIMDGLPRDVVTIPENELFLARQLGYAQHDYAVALQPLRLHDLGPGAFYSHYPETAEYVRMHA